MQEHWRGHGCEHGRTFLLAWVEVERRGQAVREIHGRPGVD